jgi:predicted metal-dependent peptidase
MNDDPIYKELQSARIKLLIEWPIFGAIILHLELKEVDWVPTAATDGRYFYYNREFCKRLDREQLMFLTAHEVLHVIFDHIFRRGNRNKDLWNMAVDYKVNYTLLANKDKEGKDLTIGKRITNIEPVDDVLFDLAYNDDLTAEEIYSLLEKNMVEIKLPLDMHLDGEGNGEDGQPKLSAEEIQGIRDMVRSVLIEAVGQEHNLEPGKIPAGILRLINRLMEPKIDWRRMLDNVLRSSIKFDYTYMRISRRSWATGFTLPGADTMDKVKAIAFLDGSGSTTREMVTDCLSECKGIMGTFPDFELTVATFDTKVYNVKLFTPENADEIDAYDFFGGGGTTPSCCWDYMKDHEMMPDKLLLFTDGHVGGDWGDPDYCDTLFIIHSNPRAVPSYGMVTYYEEKS